jgi:hypothetical protein
MNAYSFALHQAALALCLQHRKLEAEMIAVIQKIDAVKLYRQFEQRSLFKYAVDELGLSEPMAYAFISVARKAKDIAALQQAIDRREISISRAQRFVSALNSENASELIEFSKTHSCREIDSEVARLHPKAESRASVKPISANRVRITLTVSKSTLEDFKRSQSIEAQKTSASPSLEATFERVLQFYLAKNDPVRKAQGSTKRHKKHSVRTKKPIHAKLNSRVSLRAEEKRQVFQRDEGQCTHVDRKGERCTNDRWIHIHHLRPVSLGGSNEVDNLTLLCSFHHDLVHQLVLPLEEEITWLRSPQVEYRVFRTSTRWPA